MAYSDSFHTATVASATATTKVAPATAIPDNCHTLIIYNPDSGAEVYMAIGAAGAGALNPSISTIVPSSSSTTLIIGVKSDRPNPSGAFVYSTSAGNISVNITYLCSTIL